MANITSPYSPPNQGRFLLPAIFCFIMVMEAVTVYAFRQYQAKVLLKSASSLIDENRFSQAQPNASRAVQLNSLDGYAKFQYGTALYLQGNFAEAVPILESAIPVLPHAYNAIRLLAFAKYSQHKYEEADRFASKYLFMNPVPVVSPELVYRMAGLTSLRLTKLADSSYYLNQATALSNDKADLHRVRAMVLVLMNEPWSADYSFRMFQFLNSDGEFKPFELVANAIAANKLPGALEFLESIHKHSPSDLSIIKSLALASSRAGNGERARQILEEAIKANPANAELQLVMGDILYSEKQYKQAFQHYDEHLRLEPDSHFRKDILQKKATSRY